MEDLDKIIADCKAGKKKAQASLYRYYAPKLFGVSLRYSHDRTEAEDILHEAFVRIFEKIGQYKGTGSFEGWMHRIVVNFALENHRKKNRLYVVEDISTYDNNENSTINHETLNEQHLLQLIQQLPPRYKMVFNLYAIDGYSHKEIAEMLNISEGASKSNLSRARRILQTKVYETGFTEKQYAK
ncbi:MAG: RNA polymerase sigma factor [Prolixibacteraceae bacterium]|nr:RNA polymerase sigma factor [Prolixibacteraceae bacterium]MBN2650651.1 RNA polymerase sigma factor [Prolixibacteraceae bacterium]